MAKVLEVIIDVRSIEKLAKGLKGFRKQIAAEFKTALTHTLLDIERVAKERCPVDTGRLRASISPDVVSPTEGYVGTNVSYAAAVEYGTRAHDIAPRTRKALAWIDKKTGERRFARKVRHPGTKARPFLEPAYLAGKESAQRRFDAALDRLTRALKRQAQ